MVYLSWLVILLIPYWLGPIIVWLTQKAGARPVFEPFTPGRHLLARRFYAFCPDIVEQGTETVAALARDLLESLRLQEWADQLHGLAVTRPVYCLLDVVYMGVSAVLLRVPLTSLRLPP